MSLSYESLAYMSSTAKVFDSMLDLPSSVHTVDSVIFFHSHKKIVWLLWLGLSIYQTFSATNIV